MLAQFPAEMNTRRAVKCDAPRLALVRVSRSRQSLPMNHVNFDLREGSLALFAEVKIDAD